jgi:hypothetical protein
MQPDAVQRQNEPFECRSILLGGLSKRIIKMEVTQGCERDAHSPFSVYSQLTESPSTAGTHVRSV